MCRFMIYKGAKSMLMADLLTHPTRSIITQSYACRERMQNNPLNGDGFGVGWYTDRSEEAVSKKEDPSVPCVFTSVTPAWNNVNLKRLATKVRSPLIFAHVRAAIPGMLVSEANCHPFQYGRYLWMHNGMVTDFKFISRKARDTLKDEVFHSLQGTTDSELAFGMFLNQLEDPLAMAEESPESLRHKVVEVIRQIRDLKRSLCPVATEASLLNFAVTDGQTVIATRYVDQEGTEPATLYFSTGTHFECDSEATYRIHVHVALHLCRVCTYQHYSRSQLDEADMRHEEVRHKVAIITSEPLTDFPQDWLPVPRNHVIVITKDLTVLLFPIVLDDPSPPPHLPAPPPPTSERSSPCKRQTNFENELHSAIKKIKSQLSEDDEVLPMKQVDTEFITHRLSHTMTGHCGPVLALEVVCSREWLFSGGQDTRILLWDLKTFRRLKTLTGHTGSVFAFTALTRHLCSASSDGTIRIWDLETLECQTVLIDSVSSIFALASTGDSSLFAARQDTSIKLFDSTPFGKIPRPKELSGHRGFVYALAMYRDLLISGSGDGSIKVWNVKSLQCLCTLRSHTGAVFCLCVEAGLLYSGSKDGTIKVWDLDNFQLIRTLTGHVGEVLSIAASSHLLYSASNNGSIKVWDRDKLLPVHSIDHPHSSTKALSILYRAGQLIVARGEGIEVWSRIQVDTPCKPLATQAPLSGSLLDTLATFVAMKTVSSDPALSTECWRAAKFLLSCLESLGVETRLIQAKREEGRNPIVVGRLGSDPALPTVAFYGHYDVVSAVEKGWDSNPWEVVGRNGYLYGRGVTDNQGPIVAALYAVKDLQASVGTGGKLPFNLVFVYEGQEECQSEGFKEAILENIGWFTGVKCVLITNTCWLGETRPCLIYGLRGVIDLEVEISGPSRDLHSGVDGGVICEPFHELAHVLSHVVDGNGKVLVPGFYDRVRPVTDEEKALYSGIEFNVARYKDSIATCGLRGNCSTENDFLMQRWRHPNLSILGVETTGTGSRVISRSVKASISIRHVPDQVTEDIVAQLSAHIRNVFASLKSPNKISVSVIHSGDWWLGDPRSVYYQAAGSAIEKVWGVKPMFVREGGTIPITPFLEHTLHAPVVHLPLSTASNCAHLDNECIGVQHLHKAKEVIKCFLTEIHNNCTS